MAGRTDGHGGKMRINKYKTLQENGIPYLVKESGTNYKTHETCDSPQKITQMLNDVFGLAKETEEYMYLIALSNNCKIQGVFEISHGTVNCTLCSPREIFQKAILCGASMFILAHNHPSGSLKPSNDDISLTKRVYDAGKLMNISLADHIIVGANDEYFSFKDNSLVIE